MGSKTNETENHWNQNPTSSSVKGNENELMKTEKGSKTQKSRKIFPTLTKHSKLLTYKAKLNFFTELPLNEKLYYIGYRYQEILHHIDQCST